MKADNNLFKMFPENLVAYQGFANISTDVHGHIERGHDGFYFRQTRFLSKMVLTVNGKRPMFVSANPVDSYSMIAYYLAPSPSGVKAGAEPDNPRSDGGEIAKKAIEIQIGRFVSGGMHQDLRITNRGLSQATVELAWELEADFADLEEVIEHQGRRLQNGPVAHEWEGSGESCELRMTYGHPALSHGTIVRFDKAQEGPHYSDGRVVYRLTLGARESFKVCLDLLPVFCDQVIASTYDCGSFRSQDTRMDQARDAWLADTSRLVTPNAVVQGAWDRAAYDLAALPLFDGEGAEIYTPAAGIPLYQELYARDPLTTGWQAGLLNPVMLKGTLLMVGRHLGHRDDPAHDEQPGRVIQQAKKSPLALLGLNPFIQYYGDYAGPGMFLISAAWYYTKTGDKSFIRHLRPKLQAVLNWIDRDADLDGDGFYEYTSRQGDPRGKNQGWMDSPEALLYEDGRLMPNPIAVAEVQGYYYAAKQMLGLVHIALGEVSEGRELLKQAGDLKRRFNQTFWLADEGYLAQALDPEKRPVRNVASNMGHCLATGIVDHDKALAVADRLMAPDMFSGWGIRTLSSEHPAFNPFGYHFGSVWPSENASIALGFKRYGLTRHFHRLAKAIFDATLLFDQQRLPEAIGGHQKDDEHPHPGIYPLSNAPQSWSASGIICLIQAMAGLLPLAPAHTLLIDPELPEWLPELRLENVQVGDARISLQFKRDASGHTDYHVLEKRGQLRVVRQPPPDDLEARFSDRVGDFLSSLWPH